MNAFTTVANACSLIPLGSDQPHALGMWARSPHVLYKWNKSEGLHLTHLL